MHVTEGNKHLMLEALSRERFFSLDTETTGLEWSDKAFALVVATESQTFYTEAVHIIRDIFDIPCTVIMANAKFDMRMIGLPFYSCWNIRDISILERILSNDAISIASYSLDAISKKRLGLSKSKLVDEYIKEHGLYDVRKTPYTQEEYKVPRFDKVPREILQKYAELDARLTYDCYKSQVMSATADDIKVFVNECKLLHATYKMEMEGIRIDSDYTEQALVYESELLIKAKDSFHDAIGSPYENKKSLLIPLFEKSGEKISYTAKGNPRLTDEDLESFTSPAARLVQQIRYHEKRISTYFTSYLDLVDSNSIIHASILQHGTKTGRFSYAAPNLQNIPKDEPADNAYTVRGCFVPGKGNIFLSLDYSQQEYRLMLDYAGEMRVIQEVMGGKDLHQAIADMARVSRKQAKTLNFACIAKGQLVLTNTGLVPIESLTLQHLVWDGIEWVSHEGVVFNGVKEVFRYSGITATADHIVFTEEGSQVSFAEAIGRQLTLSKTGDGGNAIRVSGNNKRSFEGISKTLCVLSKMFKVYEGNECVPVKHMFWENYKLQVSSWIEAWLPLGNYTRSRECYAIRQIHGNEAAMPKQEMFSVPKLWWQGNTSKDWSSRIYIICKSKLFGRSVKGFLYRQNRQRRGLCARESKICTYGRELKEQAFQCMVYLQREKDLLLGFVEVSAERLSKFLTIKRTYQKIGPDRSRGRGHFISEGQREVYDILNCGPRHRFTVNNILVHNCLYGSGPKKISEMMGIPLSEARRLRDNYLLALPKVDKLISDVIQKNRQRGYVKNWYGRTLRNTYDNSYKAPNHLIQGGCGDVIKVAMVRIHELIKNTGIKMRLQVHDQLVFEGSKEELMHNYAEICMIMQEVYPGKNGIVLTTDASMSATSFAERDMRKWEMT